MRWLDALFGRRPEREVTPRSTDAVSGHCGGCGGWFKLVPAPYSNVYMSVLQGLLVLPEHKGNDPWRCIGTFLRAYETRPPNAVPCEWAL